MQNWKSRTISGNGCRAERRADAVDGILVIARIGFKSRVDRLLQGFEAEGDRHHLGAQDFHAGHIGSLLGNVDFAHVNFTFQPEIGGGGCERDAVLPCPGFGDQPLLAHEFGQQPLPHAVVELMSTGMVQILALQVNLAVADQAREPVAVIDRSRPPLKLAPDTPQFIDEISGVADGLIGVADLLECRQQLRRQMRTAIGTEMTVGSRVIAKIPGEIHDAAILNCKFYLTMVKRYNSTKKIAQPGSFFKFFSGELTGWPELFRASEPRRFSGKRK